MGQELIPAARAECTQALKKKNGQNQSETTSQQKETIAASNREKGWGRNREKAR